MKPYEDQMKSPRERAAALLAELSLDEKMAQLSCVFPFGEKAQDFDWIAAQVPQGVGQVSTLEMRRIRTLEDCAAWQRQVQEIVMKNSPHHIPAIFHMEGICGAFLQNSTSFPAGIARGAGWDPGLEEAIAKTVSRQEAACGMPFSMISFFRFVMVMTTFDSLLDQCTCFRTRQTAHLSRSSPGVGFHPNHHPNQGFIRVHVICCNCVNWF